MVVMVLVMVVMLIGVDDGVGGDGDVLLECQAPYSTFFIHIST